MSKQIKTVKIKRPCQTIENLRCKMFNDYKRFFSSLQRKYNEKVEYSYNTININHILYEDSCLIVAKFKEILIYHDETEFLRRYYKKDEGKNKLKKLTTFYFHCSKIYPNYMVFAQNKYLYRNIRKKQKLIDDLYKKTTKRKQTKINDNEQKFEKERDEIIDNDDNINNKDNLFFSKTLEESINKCKPSNYSGTTNTIISNIISNNNWGDLSKNNKLEENDDLLTDRKNISILSKYQIKVQDILNDGLYDSNKLQFNNIDGSKGRTRNKSILNTIFTEFSGNSENSIISIMKVLNSNTTKASENHNNKIDFNEKSKFNKINKNNIKFKNYKVNKVKIKKSYKKLIKNEGMCNSNKNNAVNKQNQEKLSKRVIFHKPTKSVPLASVLLTSKMINSQTSKKITPINFSKNLKKDEFFTLEDMNFNNIIVNINSNNFNINNNTNTPCHTKTNSEINLGYFNKPGTQKEIKTAIEYKKHVAMTDENYHSNLDKFLLRKRIKSDIINNFISINNGDDISKHKQINNQFKVTPASNSLNNLYHNTIGTGSLNLQKYRKTIHMTKKNYDNPFIEREKNYNKIEMKKKKKLIKDNILRIKENIIQTDVTKIKYINTIADDKTKGEKQKIVKISAKEMKENYHKKLKEKKNLIHASYEPNDKLDVLKRFKKLINIDKGNTNRENFPEKKTIGFKQKESYGTRTLRKKIK